MQPWDLLPYRHDVCRRLSSWLCVRHSCDENRLRRSELLSCQLNPAAAVPCWLLVRQSVDGDLVPSQQLLPPGRHGSLDVRRVRQRPVHRERLQLDQQHRVPSLHQPAVQRSVHWSGKRRQQLPVGVQRRLLPQRRPVQRLSERQLVLRQRAEHVSEQCELGCAQFESKFVLVPAGLLRQRIGLWHQPVSHLQCWVLLPWWKREFDDFLPSQLLLACRIVVLLQLPVRPGLPPRQQHVVPAVCSRPDLHQRCAEHVSCQFDCTSGLEQRDRLRLQSRFLRAEWRNVRPVPDEFLLPWR